MMILLFLLLLTMMVSNTAFLFATFLFISLVVIFHAEKTRNFIIGMMGSVLLIVSGFVGFQIFTSPMEFNSILIITVIGSLLCLRYGFKFLDEGE